MTLPSQPRRPRRLRPLPPGDAGRITPVTRILWADEQDMRGEETLACVDIDSGETLIIIREGLAPTTRREEMQRIRSEIRGLGVSRPKAWVIVAAEALRRFGWHYLSSSTAQVVGEHMLPIAAAGTVTVGAAAVGAVTIFGGHHGPGPACETPTSQRCIAWHRHHPVHITLPERPLAYLGAFEHTSQENSYSGMELFAKTCGRQPNLALYYSGWYERFQAGFALQAATHGAIPVVQIDPEMGSTGPGISLAAIANGTYDTYLINYADQVASFHKAVVIGFGHEMNGWWYPWAKKYQSPAEFVAAWRHIVDVFRMQGAYNVTWLWTVNVLSGKTPAALSQWWPGENYVTWVGIDGYYRSPDDTWASVFTPTITAVARFTGDPVLIAETAIGPVGTEPWQLSDMYASIRQGHHLGLVWFDEDKPGLQYRLEGDPSAITVFRQNTLAWRLAHQREGTTKAAGAKPLEGGALGQPSGVVKGVAKVSRPAAASSTRRIAAAIAGTSSSLSREPSRYERPSNSTQRWGSPSASSLLSSVPPVRAARLPILAK